MRWALSRDGGRTFDEPLLVDDGSPIGRSDVAFLDDGSVLILWMAELGESAELRVRRYSFLGKGKGKAKPDAPLVVTAIDPSRASGFPRLASFGNRALVTWTLIDGPHVGTALLTLSQQ